MLNSIFRRSRWSKLPTAKVLWAGLFSLLPVVAPSMTMAAQASGNDKNSVTPTEGEEQAGDFMRIRSDKNGDPISFETAIRRYHLEGKDGQSQYVDLIGVVHIGEKDYYQELNKHFESYDALLYELVAPKGTRIPKGGRNEGEITNPLAAMQNGMKSMLGLEFQLDHIDYTKDNFVHADMSPTEFGESMKKNNESFMKMFMKMMGHSLAMQGSSNAPSDAAVIMAFLSNDREMRMRRIFARQFQDADVAMTMFNGDKGSTIIDLRNDKALSVMKSELKKGHKSIGIFYGAGHLQDMDEKLVKEFGMTRGEQRWLTAWKLGDEPKEAEPMTQPENGVEAAVEKAVEQKVVDGEGQVELPTRTTPSQRPSFLQRLRRRRGGN